MSASKVYFTDMRCPVGTGLLDKLKKLIEKAGIDSIDMDSKFVAIKIHFGEPGNLSFLRPNFAKVVAAEHRLPDDHRRRPQGHRRDGSAPGRL